MFDQAFLRGNPLGQVVIGDLRNRYEFLVRIRLVHQAELEATPFIEREVAVVARISASKVVLIFRANAGQLVGQDFARYAQAMMVAIINIIGEAIFGVRQVTFALNLVD